MLKLRDKLRGGIEPKKFTHILSMLLWETIIGIDQTKFKLFAPKKTLNFAEFEKFIK